MGTVGPETIDRLKLRRAMAEEIRNGCSRASSPDDLAQTRGS